MNFLFYADLQILKSHFPQQNSHRHMEIFDDKFKT